MPGSPHSNTIAKTPPITPRDRLATLQCNQWLRPNERTTIRRFLAGNPDDDQISLLHRDMRQRLQGRTPSQHA